MGLKTSVSVFSEDSTSTNAWTSVAVYEIESACSFEINDITLIGRATSGTIGELAYCKALHRGKKIGASNPVLVGQPVYLVTFATGSDTSLNTCQMRISIIGNTIRLDVSAINGRNIDWYGGFTVVMN